LNPNSFISNLLYWFYVFPSGIILL
jgi:hypothetical protein